MAKRVFISYRRQDTAPAAGRVYDRLCTLLSKNNVFFDVSTIGGGEDFVTEVTGAIKKSDAILVFIGKKWLEPTQNGVVRIREPADHVRAEVRVALEQHCLVLPVVVDGAQMPDPEQLPEDIRGISTKNAVPLRHESFDDDTENIVSAIFGAAAKARLWDDNGKLIVKLGYAIAGVVAALILLALGALVHIRLLARPLEMSIGIPATWLLLISGGIAGAWLGLAYEAGKRRRRLHRLA